MRKSGKLERLAAFSVLPWAGAQAKFSPRMNLQVLEVKKKQRATDEHGFARMKKDQQTGAF